MNSCNKLCYRARKEEEGPGKKNKKRFRVARSLPTGWAETLICLIRTQSGLSILSQEILAGGSRRLLPLSFLSVCFGFTAKSWKCCPVRNQMTTPGGRPHLRVPDFLFGSHLDAKTSCLGVFQGGCAQVLARSRNLQKKVKWRNSTKADDRATQPQSVTLWPGWNILKSRLFKIDLP